LIYIYYPVEVVVTLYEIRSTMADKRVRRPGNDNNEDGEYY